MATSSSLSLPLLSLSLPEAAPKKDNKSRSFIAKTRLIVDELRVPCH